ncbi:glucose dehydrogenase [FAD, quinone]-like [Hyalella azteca]|uniref:Glucose dehydrogenase [FAD, quinone]-like n=1 Tax=Hyalella azteca TaxID=294128 RepID=A0A8B7NLR8_HYAAZ|nr:glucose dehydrogenase [FAD, quinone]-like [Hyalella azteca]
MTQFSVGNLLAGFTAIIAGTFFQPVRYPTSVMPDDINVDFIVVGSGSAGSVVAGRLAEISEWDVLVLEAGGQPPAFAKVPFLHFGSDFTNSSYVNYYKKRPQKYSEQFAKNIGGLYMRGKVIGGSGTINQMMHHRGIPQDYENWAAQGNPGWDYDTVLKYFKKTEDYQGPLKSRDAPFRAFGGPIGVEKVAWKPPVCRVAIRAGEEMGLAEVDYNTDTTIGSAIFQLTTKNRERVTTADAFLLPGLRRRNLKLQINSRVIKILMDAENRAIGVKYVHNNKMKRAFAKREVILSAGAGDSPKLLMLSGIGPKKHLEKLGIESRVDLPGVGQNYQDHLYVRGISWTIHPNISSSIFERVGTSAMLNYFERRSGSLTTPVGICALYQLNVGSPEEPHIPDILISQEGGLLGQDYGLHSLSPYKQSIHDYYQPIKGRDGFSMTPMLARPKSVGTVTLMSKNPFDPPVLDHNSLSHPDDFELMVKAAKASRRLGNAKIFRRALGAEPITKPIPDCAHFAFESDDYWRCFVRGWSGIGLHMCGTCKMAPDSDPMGVVTPRLKVRGVKNLRVIDASVMPSITSGHINAVTFMIGEKGADLIKEDYGKI